MRQTVLLCGSLIVLAVTGLSACTQCGGEPKTATTATATPPPADATTPPAATPPPADVTTPPAVATPPPATTADAPMVWPAPPPAGGQLQIVDQLVGSGAVAESGKKVSVHYTGWLLDGKKFDSSRDSGKPFDFTLGTGSVIAGWDQGVKGMKVGGKRRLTIPAALGYGSRGAGAAIPPDADLVFDVELLGVE